MIIGTTPDSVKGKIIAMTAKLTNTVAGTPGTDSIVLKASNNDLVTVSPTAFLQGNQTITFSPTGDVTGSTTGTTTLAPILTVGPSKITNAMLLGSISANKFIGTDIVTVGTLTAGAIGSGFGNIDNGSNSVSTKILTVLGGSVGGLVKWNYSANAASRSWIASSEGYGYPDWSLQQSTTQTGSTYTTRLLMSGADMTIGSVPGTGIGKIYTGDLLIANATGLGTNIAGIDALGNVLRTSSKVPIYASFSQVGTATTTFTVTIGSTQSNSSYNIQVTPTSALSAALFYVTNKTTTTFDVVYLAGLTGTVTFDWVLHP